MTKSIPPVIRREWSDADRTADVLHTVRDDTNYHRGLGRSGRRVEHVSHECPCCGHGEMIRLVHVNPEERDGVSYWCLMPNCRYFISDELSWATKPHPMDVPESPMVWSQTHVCEDCGRRTSKVVTKAEVVTFSESSHPSEASKKPTEYGMKRVEDGVVKDVCDDCTSAEREVES
jgi:ssDNA-binding Zn-finger/Zn-ribbon topoisomerase 1